MPFCLEAKSLLQFETRAVHTEKELQEYFKSIDEELEHAIVEITAMAKKAKNEDTKRANNEIVKHLTKMKSAKKKLKEDCGKHKWTVDVCYKKCEEIHDQFLHEMSTVKFFG